MRARHVPFLGQTDSLQSLPLPWSQSRIQLGSILSLCGEDESRAIGVMGLRRVLSQGPNLRFQPMVPSLERNLVARKAPMLPIPYLWTAAD